MTTNPNPTDVFVQGNTFQNGSASNGVTQSFYTYNSFLNTSADCRITNNTFEGGINTAITNKYFVVLTGCSCLIMNNNFFRGSNLISAYIAVSGSYDQIITNNIFDSSTTNGTNQVLVTGLTATSAYRENKNQIAYLSVPWTSYKTPVDINNGFGTNFYDPTSNDGQFGEYLFNNGDSEQLYLFPHVTCFLFSYLVNYFYNQSVNLSALLPPNVTVLSVKTSLFSPVAPPDYLPTDAYLNASGESQFNIVETVLHTIPNNTADYSTGTGSILDLQGLYNTNVVGAIGANWQQDPAGFSFNDSETYQFTENNYFTGSTSSGNVVNSIQTENIYLTITPASTVVNNQNNQIILRLKVTCSIDTMTYNLQIIVSPSVVQYMW